MLDKPRFVERMRKHSKATGASPKYVEPKQTKNLRDEIMCYEIEVLENKRADKGKKEAETPGAIAESTMKAQLGQLEKAGLNPGLIYGMGGSGGTLGGSSATAQGAAAMDIWEKTNYKAQMGQLEKAGLVS